MPRTRFLAIGTYQNQRGGRSDFRIYVTAASTDEAAEKVRSAIHGSRSYMRALDMSITIAPE